MSHDSSHLTITCTPRTLKGKQNKALRKSGLVPANIFGEGKDSESVSINAIEFKKVFAQAGETSVVYCTVDGKETPTLITEVALHPVFESYDHIDFRRVNLKKKISAQVPLKYVGESVAVRQLGGVLLQQMQEVEVEALPQNIPHEIMIDVSTITAVGGEIKITDLAKSADYEIMEDMTRVVVSVVAHREESTESQLERTETEITTAKPDEEAAAEGAAPAADAKAEAPKAEAKK